MASASELLEKLYQRNDGKPAFRKGQVLTPDPTKYHDLNEVGSPILGNMPSIGSSTVMIPRHRPEGGSLGYDPHGPLKVVIDPDLTGGKLVLNYADLTKDRINELYRSTNQVPDQIDRALTTYLLMSGESEQRAKATPIREEPVAVATSIAPSNVRPASFSKVAAAPAPTTLPPQTPVQPRPASFSAKPAVPTDDLPDSIIDDIKRPRTRPAAVTGETPVPPQKLRKVVFELPPPIRKFTAYYTDVVRTEDKLILVYDHNAGGQQVIWFPEPGREVDENGEPVLEDPIGFIVFDDDDNRDVGFVAYPTSVRYTYRGLEFAVLMIEAEKSYKEPDYEQQASPNAFG